MEDTQNNLKELLKDFNQEILNIILVQASDLPLDIIKLRLEDLVFTFKNRML